MPINKVQYSHTMEYCSIKRNKLLIHKTTWMNLNIKLSERSQRQKEKELFHLYDVQEQAKLLNGRKTE